MPALDFILEYGIDQTMLLDHRQALELCRHNVQCVHASATSADILNLFTVISLRSYSPQPFCFAYL